MRPRRAAAIPPTGACTFAAAPVADAPDALLDFVELPELELMGPEVVIMGVPVALVASVEPELVPVMLAS